MRRARVRHFVYMEIIRGCQMETITSRENAKIKYACRLREEEKLRTADGLFFAEGPKLCLELARGCTLQTLYATEKALAHTPELEAFAGKTVLVTEPVAQKLSGTKTSQDVFGVFEHPGWQAADILAKGRRILALEAVQDPGNVGTLCRTLYALGGAGIIMPRHNSAYLGPAARRAAAGALEHLPVARVTNLGHALDSAEEAGLTIYGAGGQPGSGSLDAFAEPMCLPAILVLGNEDKGLRPGVAKRCAHMLRIPLARTFDSLNVAQAGAILLGLAASVRAKS